MRRSPLRYLPLLLCILLPLLDLVWNLTHLNIGLPDFYGLALPARAFALHGAWPQTPYFPALYPLLLVPFGVAGSVLVGGYILSALGLMLALAGMGRLIRMIVGAHALVRPEPGDPPRAGVAPAPTWLLSTAFFLAWLMPVWRVVAGSPSVDALYTGLGIWFIAAAAEVWVGAAHGRPGPRMRGPYGKSAVLILWLTALLLPLLRYHAVILVFPIALGLLICCPRARWTARAALMAGIAGMCINFGGYLLAYGELPAPVAGLQIRCGIEFEQHIHYPTPQDLWDDYAAFAAHGRTTPLLADYSVGQIAKHVLRNWLMFLRQPAVLLALVLVLLGARSNKSAEPTSRGAAGLPSLLIAWVLLYTLTLALAYYTARAALLPCVVGLAVFALFLVTPAIPIRVGLLALVLAGYGAGSRFAFNDFRSREAAAEESVRLVELLPQARMAAGWSAQLDPLVANLSDPWVTPFPTAKGSWLDDPAIPRELTDGWEMTSVPAGVKIPEGMSPSEYFLSLPGFEMPDSAQP